MRNSPACTGSGDPNRRAMARKVVALPGMTPIASSCSATLVKVAPCSMTSVCGPSCGPALVHKAVYAPAAASAARPSKTSSHRFTGADSHRPHDQAGLGAAEAEAVVENRLHRPFLCHMGHQIDARADAQSGEQTSELQSIKRTS